MLDRDFIGDRAHHDAGDDGYVEIRVHGAREAAWIRGTGDLTAAALGADVEIDPPHCHAAEKCHEKSGDGRVRRRHGGGRRPRHEDGFTERDDDEQRAAFGHVSAIDFPVGGIRAAETRHEIPDDWPADLERERHDPCCHALVAAGETASDPENRRHAKPGADALKVAMVDRVAVTRRCEHEQRTRDLNEGVGDCE
jgi:hypothetical protein